MLDQWIEAEMKGMEDLELQDMSTTQCLQCTAAYDLGFVCSMLCYAKQLR